MQIGICITTSVWRSCSTPSPRSSPWSRLLEEWVAPGRSYIVDYKAAASGEVADLNALTRDVLAALEAKLS